MINPIATPMKRKLKFIYYEIYKLYLIYHNLLTEDVDRSRTYPLLFSENLEYLNISSATTSVIFVLEYKRTSSVSWSSTNTSSGLLILLWILYDLIYLFNWKLQAHELTLRETYKYISREHWLTISISCRHASHFPSSAKGPVPYAMHSTQFFSSSHRCPGHI